MFFYRDTTACADDVLFQRAGEVYLQKMSTSSDLLHLINFSVHSPPEYVFRRASTVSHNQNKDWIPCRYFQKLSDAFLRHLLQSPTVINCIRLFSASTAPPPPDPRIYTAVAAQLTDSKRLEIPLSGAPHLMKEVYVLAFAKEDKPPFSDLFVNVVCVSEEFLGITSVPHTRSSLSGLDALRCRLLPALFPSRLASRVKDITSHILCHSLLRLPSQVLQITSGDQIFLIGTKDGNMIINETTVSSMTSSSMTPANQISSNSSSSSCPATVNPALSPSERVASVFKDAYIREAVLMDVPGTSSLTRAFKIVRTKWLSLSQEQRSFTFVKKLELLPFDSKKITGLFAVAQFLDENGAYGVSTMSICHKFLRELWMGYPPVRQQYLGDKLSNENPSQMETFQRSQDRGSRQLRIFWSEFPRSISQDFLKTLTDKLTPCNDDSVRLFHGCHIADAEMIVDSVNKDMLEDFSDFGKAFYTTPQLWCALFYMNTRVNDVRSVFDGAVVVIDIPKKLLSQLTTVDEVRTDNETWNMTVKYFRQNRADFVTPDLQQRLLASRSLTGPIIRNADELQGNVEALKRVLLSKQGNGDCEWEQVAFRVASGGSDGVDFINTCNEIVFHVVRLSTEKHSSFSSSSSSSSSCQETHHINVDFNSSESSSSSSSSSNS
jgi:hypothetical protein